MNRWIVRVYLCSPGERANRFAKTNGHTQRLSQVIVISRNVRATVNGTLDKADRSFSLPTLQMQNPQQMKSIGLLRVVIENLPISFFSTKQITRLMGGYGRSQGSRDRIRHWNVDSTKARESGGPQILTLFKGKMKENRIETHPQGQFY